LVGGVVGGVVGGYWLVDVCLVVRLVTDLMAAGWLVNCLVLVGDYSW